MPQQFLTPCRYGWRCNRPGCWFKHPRWASRTHTDSPDELVSALSTMSLNSDGRQSLLDQFRDIFDADHRFMVTLQRRLESPSSKMCLIFVDLDNVPRFFEKVTPEMLELIPMECFIICSARSTNSRRWTGSDKIHFTLAMPTKDAADAVCTVASAKLDSILRVYGRQKDVPMLIASDDKIFWQVTALLNDGGARAFNLTRQDVMAGGRMLQQAASGRALRDGPESTFKCKDCGRTFGSKRALDQHCDNLGRSDFECGECGRTFGSEHALDQHCKDTGHEDSDSEYECGECGRTFGSERALDQHCEDTGHYS